MNKVVFVCLSIVILIFTEFIDSRDSLLRIYFLNIGQGDSILIKTPDQKLMLIDGGPDATVLAQLGAVLPALTDKIDLVVATHPDKDHVAGLIDVEGRFRADRTEINLPLKLELSLQEAAQKNNSQIIKLDSETDFNFGCCVKVDVLWPYPGFSDPDTNNNSVSLLISYGSFSMYSGGDLPKQFEEQILLPLDQQLSVIKLGHHGSRTSTSERVMERLLPGISVISAGKDNSYGHPHQEVLAILAKIPTRVYRTDQQGRIEIDTDGNTYTVKTGD
jgi:competence protein ComEC